MILLAATLALAQIAPAPEEPQPIATTVAAIVANPRKFDGQVVRLHGYVNSCQPTCTLAERAANAPGGAGASLPIVPTDKFDAVVLPLVPTYVEFDALFRAGCDAGSICLDGAPKLRVVTLRGVVSPEPPPFENP
jgi:hypothetical protein